MSEHSLEHGIGRAVRKLRYVVNQERKAKKLTFRFYPCGMVRCSKDGHHGYGNSMETAYQNFEANQEELQQYLFETGEHPESRIAQQTRFNREKYLNPLVRLVGPAELTTAKLNFWSELLNFFRR